MWPTVIWQGTNLRVYYLGEKEDENHIKETNGIDFEEFFLHLDKGGSIFITIKPQNELNNELHDDLLTKNEADPKTPLLNDMF